MSRRGFFITGTDTDVGKTAVAVGLMRCLSDAGHKVQGMKPVASGAELIEGELQNSDALALIEQSSRPCAYSIHNPYAFQFPIAPHLAASEAGVEIDLKVIGQQLQHLVREDEVVVVEGVGGWLVPLNARHTTEDLALQLGLKVLLVVGIRLGCINHALLTEQAIRRSGLELVGWVANSVDKSCQFQQEIIESLEERLHSPCLSRVPWVAPLDCSHTANFLLETAKTL